MNEQNLGGESFPYALATWRLVSRKGVVEHFHAWARGYSPPLPTQFGDVY